MPKNKSVGINNMIRNIVTLGFLLAFCFPAAALRDDTSQQILINSASQSLDMQTNTITFTGNVVINQGSINVTADSVVVKRQGNEQGTEIIEAFGNPVRFSQKQDNGKVVKGRSSKLHYDLKSEKLILTGKASLQQLNSSVTSERIVYLVKEQKMEASSSSGSKVVTVLEPSQLRNSNTPAEAPQKSSPAPKSSPAQNPFKQ
jgi:lipopolysaccharide export system protein LptA